MIAVIVSSSVLILLLAALRRLLRGRIDPRIQYALWLLVAVRLLVPTPLFPSPVSLNDAANSFRTHVLQSIPLETQPTTEALSQSQLVNELISPYTVEKQFPAGTSADAWSAEPPGTDYHVNGYEIDPGTGIQTVRYSHYASFWEMPFWRWPWYAGILLVGSAALVSNLAFTHRLRKTRRLLPEEDLPISCRVPVYLVEELPSPCLCGLFLPSVYVNQAALSPQRLTHILTHELSHLRHGDPLWAVVRGLCLAIHWYNPLVWWAAVLSRRDCELACDASAIRRLGEEQRLEYGQTLVSMTVPGRPLTGLMRTATTMTAGKRTMVERISLIARRPRMLKITLAAVVLVAFAAAAVTLGGSSGAPADPSPSQPVTPPAADIAPSSQPAPGITEAEALALYREARETWDWFELGTLPTTSDTYADQQGSYQRVTGFDSLADLRTHLLTLFSPELTESLLTGFQPLREVGGGLFLQSAQRGSNLYAGEETVQVFLMTPADAAQAGYDGHIYATTEVLDQNDLATVLYNKRHDWFFAWNGEHYVFTAFGPWDDVDPQKYDNALTILDYCRQGGTIASWQPLLRDLDWNALGATRSQWPEGTDPGEYVLSAIHQLIAQEGSGLSGVAYHDILSATEGLDGAYAEGFSAIVWQLYALDPVRFAQTALEELTAEQRAAVVRFLARELAYCMGQDEALPTQAVLDRLEKTLAGEPVPVVPSTVYAYFTQPGETTRLVPVGGQEVYTAEFSAADPAVAAVDSRDGTITAVGPGETTVSLHVENGAGQFDFTCQVVCQWGGSPVSPADSQTAPPQESPGTMEDWEVINGISRSYFPSVLTIGSPAELTFDLADDWSLEAIRSGLWDALTGYVAGTALEGELHQVNISYSFQFPAEMREGVVLTVPYTAVYQSEPQELPSGATFAPQGETELLTASVRLTGQGGAGGVDADFAAGQALYQQLAACAQVEALTVQAGSQDSILPLLSAAIDKNLAAAGLNGKYYRLSTTLSGPFHEPAALSPGDAQEVPYTVTIAPTDSIQEAMTFTGVLTCTTTE